ncbi:MAG: amidohydrolase family protein, partial [Pseudomonadota bacterium]
PAGLETIDAGGNYVTPGLIDASSSLGIVEVGAVRQTNDRSAGDSPYSAALDVAAAINPASTAMAVARIEGVTRAAVMPAPADDLFGGIGRAVSLDATDTTPVLPGHRYLTIDLGEGGARRAGGSRAAAFTRLADAFREADAFARNRSGYAFGRTKDALLTRADAEALVDVIRGRIPAMISVDRASDIRAVLALKSDYPRMDMILTGVAEGWLVADELARANVPVIVTPTQNLPARFETLAATQSNAGRLAAAGVKVAITDGASPSISPQLPQQAGQTVAQARIPGASGLSHEDAVAAITGVPAMILGLDDAGRIARGNHADIVIWDGDPLETTSAPTAIWIDGNAQPMESRQTKLAARYNPTAPDTNLPKQYSRGE